MSDDEDDYTLTTDASDKVSMLLLATSSDDASDLAQPLTYLQLGAYPTWGTSSQRGDDLLEAIGLTSTTTQFFKDDFRWANGLSEPSTKYWRADGNTTTETTPSALTAELMTRGGIRLHTDDNYVSTTRGDRVDVIFGNHHLAVLGRTGSADAYRESSGGHAVRADRSTPHRTTLVSWNAARGAFRTYEETVKGNHTTRFEGPLETTYECDEIVERVGRAYDDDADEAPLIPATSAEAHEQTDAADKWVNPSSGEGTGWPRSEESPDLDEEIAALDVRESTKVRASLGAASSTGPAAGSFTVARRVTGSESRRVTAGREVRDVVESRNGAKLTEAAGFDASLVSSASSDQVTGTDYRIRAFVAGYRGALFTTRTTDLGGSKWPYAVTLVDIIGLDARVSTGVRLTAPNLSKVTHPSYDSVLGGVISTFFFGTSDTIIKVASNTLEVTAARASVAISTYKSRVSANHLDAHLVGAAYEVGLGRIVATLAKSAIDAARAESGATKLTLASLYVKS
ncbi:MAG: hypothetical protein U0271_29685 [Polyangiaceae bacterium]